MRAKFQEYDETRVAIPTYLAACVFIFGALGWGFYQLMQPTQYANPGVAAYKAPPGIGITFLPASIFSHERALPVPNESDLEHPADETTGHATPSPDAEPAVGSVPRPQIKPGRKKEIRRATRERKEVRHVQHSAPMQSHLFA